MLQVIEPEATPVSCGVSWWRAARLGLPFPSLHVEEREREIGKQYISRKINEDDRGMENETGSLAVSLIELAYTQ